MRKVNITHPDKVLFHASGITKRDLAAYYLKVADPLMHYAKDRPLSFKRYTKGYPGTHFFQRNKPKFAPDWIEAESIGIHTKARYILPQNIDTFLWLVNLDALEFHIAQSRPPDFLKPDMLVFDLDPPHEDGTPLDAHFRNVKSLAFGIKPLIESFGYHCFVKTSGLKGIHIYCPIHPNHSYDEVFIAAMDIGNHIVREINNTTLKISKSERTGKTLIDVYRNHTLQSMAMPYGTRANKLANVSMPLPWKTLKKLQSPNEYNIQSVPGYLELHGDAWADIYAHAVDLHI